MPSLRRRCCLRLRLAGVAAAWLALPCALATAATQPVPPPADEANLLAPEAHAALGRFDTDGHAVRLTSPGPQRQSHWLAAAPVIGDGIVRFRLEGGRPRHVGLLARAGTRGPHRRLDGYHLAIRPGEVAWMRWDNGVLRPLGASTRAPGLGAVPALEVRVWMIGPSLIAELLDARTLQPVAHVSARDAAFAAGHLGWMQFSRAGTAVRWTWLSATPAAAPAPLLAPDGRGHGALGPAAPPVAPAGPWRWWVVPASDVVALPAEARALVSWRAAWWDASLRLARVAAPLVEPWRRWAPQFGAPLAVDSPFLAWMPGLVERGRARGAALARAGLVRERYLDADAVAGWLEQLAAHRDGARVLQVGTSRQGRPILALHLPAIRADAPAVLVDGGHHGDELASVVQVLDAAEHLVRDATSDPWLGRVRAELDVWLVPLVNPDGLQSFLELSGSSGRKNGADGAAPCLASAGGPCASAGVDLNRNYPFRWGELGERGSSEDPDAPYFRGPAPASEPETQAMMRLGEAVRPVLALSFHTVAGVVLQPYTIDGTPQPAGPLLASVARAAAAAGRRIGVQTSLYPVDGTSNDWQLAALGAVALLIEGPSQNPVAKGRLAADTLAVRAVWRAAVARVVDGPRVEVELRDAAGHPTTAHVHTDAMVPQGREVWLSLPGRGVAHRLLAGNSGIVTVRDGAGTEQQRAIEVDAAGVARVAFTVGRGEVACPVPALASAEARCRAVAGKPPALAGDAPSFCYVGGRCLPAAAEGPEEAMGCGCRPALDARSLRRRDGSACGRAAEGT